MRKKTIKEAYDKETDQLRTDINKQIKEHLQKEFANLNPQELQI